MANGLLCIIMEITIMQSRNFARVEVTCCVLSMGCSEQVQGSLIHPVVLCRRQALSRCEKCWLQKKLLQNDIKYDKSSIYHDTICQRLSDKGSSCENVGDELSGSTTWVYETVLGDGFTH